MSKRVSCRRLRIYLASEDKTVQVLPDTPVTSKPPPAIKHSEYVKSILPLLLTDLTEPYLLTGAGDTIRVYDVSSLEEPEFIREIEGHWREVTAIRLWIRSRVGNNGKPYTEPWIVSAGLDSTIRKWKLSGKFSPSSFRSLRTIIFLASELLAPAIVSRPTAEPVEPVSQMVSSFQLSEEEERQLDELLDSD